jgi:hypothetical protein
VRIYNNGNKTEKASITHALLVLAAAGSAAVYHQHLQYACISRRPKLSCLQGKAADTALCKDPMHLHLCFIARHTADGHVAALKCLSHMPATAPDLHPRNTLHTKHIA